MEHVGNALGTVVFKVHLEARLCTISILSAPLFSTPGLGSHIATPYSIWGGGGGGRGTGPLYDFPRKTLEEIFQITFQAAERAGTLEV